MSQSENRESTPHRSGSCTSATCRFPWTPGPCSARTCSALRTRGAFPCDPGYGLFGKDLTFQVGYARQWEVVACKHPEALAHSSNRYQNWLVVDRRSGCPTAT
jgi:hypothetical protein